LQKKFGKNPKLFNQLESVRKIKGLQPLINGKQYMLQQTIIEEA